MVSLFYLIDAITEHNFDQTNGNCVINYDMTSDSSSLNE